MRTFKLLLGSIAIGLCMMSSAVEAVSITVVNNTNRSATITRITNANGQNSYATVATIGTTSGSTATVTIESGTYVAGISWVGNNTGTTRTRSSSTVASSSFS